MKEKKGKNFSKKKLTVREKLRKKCPNCGKEPNWQYFRFDNNPSIVYRYCSHCQCLLMKGVSWRFLTIMDLKDLMLSFTKKLKKELLTKKKNLSLREKLRKKPCPGCGKKMWKFGSKSSGDNPGYTVEWWKCRNCGYKVPF